MKTTLFAAALVIASVSSLSSASAQVSGNVNNIKDQIFNNNNAQRIFCQVRPNRSCANDQRTQPGQRTNSQRRTGQQGGGARP